MSIDYRVYDPAGDGHGKLDHVAEMLRNAMYHKQLSCYAVLMDSWYATKAIAHKLRNLRKCQAPCHPRSGQTRYVGG